jgi:pimeloyl-ACP methyl ester carboxylesterase
MKNIPSILSFLVLFGSGLIVGSAELIVSRVAFVEDGSLGVQVPVSSTKPASYYRLVRLDGENLSERNTVDLLFPASTRPSIFNLRDADVFSRDRAFYQVEEIPIARPLDSDDDGIDDLFEAQHPKFLDPLDPTDAGEDADGDGDSNLAEYNTKTDPAEVAVSDVTFVTSDSITISGQLRRPAARPGTSLPTVILIHQGFRTRAEWNPFLSAFSEAGYTTLAYDIRGHGASGGTFTSADFDNPNTSPKDLEAAIAYVIALSGSDADRIGIVGVSVGGNLACVASQKRWVKTAVNISGKTSAVRNLSAENELDLESMFHISSSGDGGGQRAIWANELHGFTSGPRQVEVVPGSSAHGIGVINADPTLLDRIITWLAETL